jgi:hypothetical protein
VSPSDGIDPLSVIAGWIKEEESLSRAESKDGIGWDRSNPRDQACMVANILGAHIEEFLHNRQLVETLAHMFKVRGVAGEDQATLFVMLAAEMSAEQLPVFNWLVVAWEQDEKRPPQPQ